VKYYQLPPPSPTPGRRFLSPAGELPLAVPRSWISRTIDRAVYRLSVNVVPSEAAGRLFSISREPIANLETAKRRARAHARARGGGRSRQRKRASGACFRAARATFFSAPEAQGKMPTSLVVARDLSLSLSLSPLAGKNRQRSVNVEIRSAHARAQPSCDVVLAGACPRSRFKTVYYAARRAFLSSRGSFGGGPLDPFAAPRLGHISAHACARARPSVRPPASAPAMRSGTLPLRFSRTPGSLCPLPSLPSAPPRPRVPPRGSSSHSRSGRSVRVAHSSVHSRSREERSRSQTSFRTRAPAPS